MSKSSPKRCAPENLFEMAGENSEIFLQLIEIFFRESRNQFTEMKSAAAIGDMVKCGNYCHSLKGTVGALGADNLVQMLQKLEDDCHQKRGDCGTARIAMVGVELHRVRTEVQKFIAHF